MLTYAHECSRMLTYAHVCSRMLTYAMSHRLRVHPRQRPEAVRAADASLGADGDGYGRPQVLSLLVFTGTLVLSLLALPVQ
jgi:hypothetical protein